MARKNDKAPQFNADDAIKVFQGLPPKARIAVVIVLLVAVGIGVGYWIYSFSKGPQGELAPPPREVAGVPGYYWFCTWNVENYFDDVDDPQNHDDMEDWFGRDAAAFRLKTERIAEALLMMNGGHGPDIAALIEVESERCINALRDALNSKLQAAGKGDLVYQHVLFKEDKTGRRFAPGILTRLDVVADRTQKLGAGGLRRTVEGHIKANGHELIVIASHWTSRVREDTSDNRMRYAEACYGRARAIITANPAADVLVCGDFNDEFKDPSIQIGLRATDNADAVKTEMREPLLLDLMAGLEHKNDPKGTISYERKWQIFDHICVSRGLLDESGWACEPLQTEIFGPKELRTGKDQHPFGFGREKHKGERGYSDHLPVLTRLRTTGTVDTPK